jgi:hypothetical protein
MTTEFQTKPPVVRSYGNGSNPDSLQGLLEKHVREHPLKAAAQAAAVGYALRLLPLRSLFVVGARLAGPVMCLIGLWKAVDRLEAQPSDRKSRR